MSLDDSFRHTDLIEVMKVDPERSAAAKRAALRRARRASKKVNRSGMKVMTQRVHEGIGATNGFYAHYDRAFPWKPKKK